MNFKSLLYCIISCHIEFILLLSDFDQGQHNSLGKKNVYNVEYSNDRRANRFEARGGVMADSVTDFYDRLSPEYRDNMGWDWEAEMRREGATLQVGPQGPLHIARLHLWNWHPGDRLGTSRPPGTCFRFELDIR
jgi:hypothetical protein